MGCKNSKSKESQNRFDTSRGRSESQHSSGKSPRNHSRTPSTTPRSARNRDRESQREKEEEKKLQAVRPRVTVTEVPLEFARFESLPADCIKRYVYRVYDGDTITLRGEDNAKVRLLAMDSPEMQDNEPFAVEARDFLAKYILDKKVYLGFEGVQKDRYGRYLAYVFVKDASVPPYRYLCANIAVVEAGLGNYYHPQGTPLTFDTIFLDAQRSARHRKINVWNGVDENYEVYVTPHGHAFHTKTCLSVQNVPLSCIVMRDALDQGQYACRDCHPNWASKLPSKASLLSKLEANRHRHASEGPAADDVVAATTTGADGDAAALDAGADVTIPEADDLPAIDGAAETQEIDTAPVVDGDAADEEPQSSPPHCPSTTRDEAADQVGPDASSVEVEKPAHTTAEPVAAAASEPDHATGSS